MASSQKKSKSSFFVNLLTVLASLAGIITLFLAFFPLTQTYSASGAILSADSLRIPGAHFSYSIDRKSYTIDSADASGNYKIQMRLHEVVYIHFLCRHGKDTIDTSVKLVNPDNISQNIFLVSSTAGQKIAYPEIDTIDPETQKKKKKPATTSVNTNHGHLKSDTGIQQNNEMPELPVSSTPQLREYVLKRSDNGTEIPYYSDNVVKNSHVSPAGFLDYRTTLTTLIIPTDLNTESIFFSFFNKDLNRPTKGWIKLENLNPKVH